MHKSTSSAKKRQRQPSDLSRTAGTAEPWADGQRKPGSAEPLGSKALGFTYSRDAATDSWEAKYDHKS